MKQKYMDFIDQYENISKFLIEVYGVEESVIEYATTIYGINEETFNNIIEYYTEYHDIWQLVECDGTIEESKEYNLELFEEDEEEEEE